MRKGAPPKYTDKQLKDILLKHITKNPGRKVNPSLLEKDTGISRFIWSRRMSDQIATMNETTQQQSADTEASLLLPNVVELVETYWNNKTGLISALGHFNEMLNTLYQKAKVHASVLQENQNLSTLLSEKEKQIKKLDHEMESLRKQYLRWLSKAHTKLFKKKKVWIMYYPSQTIKKYGIVP